MLGNVGIGLFLLGVLFIGLSLTFTPSSGLLLLGIIFTGAGVGAIYLESKT